MKVLETPRLVLRRITLEDAPFLLKLLNDPSFLYFIGDKGVRTLGEAQDYILTGPMSSYAKHGFGLYLVLTKAHSEPIGMCGLLKRDELPDVDLGFALMPAFRIQGYATESAGAVLAYGKEQLGLKRIVAIVASDNTASAHVLQKLGLRFERMLRLSGDLPEIKLFGPGTEA